MNYTDHNWMVVLGAVSGLRAALGCSEQGLNCMCFKSLPHKKSYCTKVELELANMGEAAGSGICLTPKGSDRLSDQDSIEYL